MAKSPNQKLKLLYLIRFLMQNSDENHPLSMAQIISELENNGISAERKSIYDDMEALRIFGFDVIKVGGKNGGYYIYVVPAARHLWELKAAIYDVPYENREEDTPYEGFEHVETRRVRYKTEIKTSEDIFALFQMTPYYWKTSAKGAEKLKKYESLLTEVAFDIHIYKKEK